MKIDISIKELFADDSKLHCYEKNYSNDKS